MEPSSASDLLGDFGRAVSAMDELANLRRRVLVAQRERNSAIRALCDQHGPSTTARMLGMKLPTVKAINSR